MPFYSPAASALDGSETIRLFLARGMGKTLTVAQLRAYARGLPIPAGAGNAPVGLPAASALDGTEQVQVMQGAGTKIATIAQIATWCATGTAAAYAPSSAGGLGGFPSASGFDGSETIWIGQGGGAKALGFTSLQAFVSAS